MKVFKKGMRKVRLRIERSQERKSKPRQSTRRVTHKLIPAQTIVLTRIIEMKNIHYVTVINKIFIRLINNKSNTRVYGRL